MHFNELVTIHIVPMKMSWEEDVDFLAENSGDQDSQYNFVIDKISSK